MYTIQMVSTPWLLSQDCVLGAFESRKGSGTHIPNRGSSEEPLCHLGVMSCWWPVPTIPEAMEMCINPPYSFWKSSFLAGIFLFQRLICGRESFVTQCIKHIVLDYRWVCNPEQPQIYYSSSDSFLITQEWIFPFIFHIPVVQILY